jgi:hypothetical protein
MSGVFHNIDPPPPHRQAIVYPPPPPLLRGEDTLAGWIGGGGSTVRKTPDTTLYSIYESTLCAGITTVLTMTFLGLEARKDLPKVPYPTALDYFVFISFTYIFTTVVQFGLVHHFTKVVTSTVHCMLVTEEPGVQCTVVFALIVREPASECVCGG